MQSRRNTMELAELLEILPPGELDKVIREAKNKNCGVVINAHTREIFAHSNTPRDTIYVINPDMVDPDLHRVYTPYFGARRAQHTTAHVEPCRITRAKLQEMCGESLDVIPSHG